MLEVEPDKLQRRLAREILLPRHKGFPGQCAMSFLPTVLFSFFKGWVTLKRGCWMVLGQQAL